MNNHLYRPIRDKRSFRILEVCGSDSRQSPIECNLLQGSLDDDRLHYEAVSYCWAGQTPTRPIRCNGKEAYVTKNCEAALLRFRPVGEDQRRLLWIDLLCINQEDIPERSSQVGVMGEIYAKADQVLIWLGNETEPVGGSTPSDTEHRAEAFDWMVRLASASEERDLEGGKQRLVRVVKELKDRDIQQFVDSVPWFKRCWVIQEVALSKKAVFFYGQATTTLESLIRADFAIHELQVSGAFGANDAVSNPLWNALAVHRMAKGVLDSFNHQTPSDAIINDFLGEMRWSQASEPKDKVFSLYGILGASGVSPPLPDYSKSTADVYRETAVAVIQSTKGLRILEQVDSTGVTPDLASWVPDWSSWKHCIGLLGHYHASIPTTPTPFFDFRDDRRKLVVRGCTIDSIAARCEFSMAHKNEKLGDPDKYLTWTKNCQPTEPFWKSILEMNPQHSAAILSFWNLRVLRAFVDFSLGNDPASASEETILALYYTLMSQCDSHEDVVRDRTDARLWLFMLSGRQDLLGDDVVDAGQEPTAIRNVHDTPSLAEIMQTPEYTVCKSISHSSICRTFQDRIDRIRYKTIFHTASGKVGIAPYAIRAEDEIVLLEGLRMPMVVRQSGSDYRLIGQAHVQGIGGADAWLGKDAEVREICLV